MGMYRPPAVDLKAEGYPFVMLAADLRELLRISENTLYARIKTGVDVPAWDRSGRRYVWKRPDVERWLAMRADLRVVRRAS